MGLEWMYWTKPTAVFFIAIFLMLGGMLVVTFSQTLEWPLYTAVPAAVLATGLIGMAVAFSRYEIALVMALINFVTLRYVRHLKQNPGGRGDES